MNPDIIAGSVQCFGESSMSIIHEEGLKYVKDILNESIYFSFGWGGLIKIKFFNEGLRFIDSPYIVNDDNFFGLDLFLRSKRVYYTSKICVYYRVAEGSVSNPKSYYLNGFDNLYETYYLNAHNIKLLLDKYPQYSKIINYNISYNANSFAGISATLGRFDKNRIKEMYKFLCFKYKFYANFPKTFRFLKNLKRRGLRIVFKILDS